MIVLQKPVNLGGAADGHMIDVVAYLTHQVHCDAIRSEQFKN